MNISVDIVDESDLWEGVPDRADIARRIILTATQLARTEWPGMAEVCLMFCDDARIRELNRQWRALDKPTNVLSFPSKYMIDGSMFLGDIAIAFETVAIEARENDVSMSTHTAHLVAHGFLHLLGYDHEIDTDAEEMESIEREILAAHGIADPYRSSTLSRAKNE